MACRRTLEGPAFSPFRMSFWKPESLSEGGGERKPGQVGLLDSAKIFVTNALQIVSGQPRGYDGAPVAEVGKYTVSGGGREGGRREARGGGAGTGLAHDRLTG